MNAVPSSDVVVIGAGLIGLSCAWRATQAGLTVTVLDDSPERAASRTAAGMLAPVSELQYGELALLRLGLLAAARYGDFVAELTEITGTDVDYRQCGTISVAFDNDDHRALSKIFEYVALQQVGVQRLRGQQCREKEPLLAPSVRGGWLVESDHQVDPRKLLDAVGTAAKLQGVRVLLNRATRLLTNGERVRGVQMASGEIAAAPKVVVAAGSWSANAIAGVPPDARPPVRPVKGQLLRLRAGTQTPFLRHTVRGLVGGVPVYAVPRGDGKLILGATSEEQGYDRRVTLESIYHLVRYARLLIPGITELELSEISTGLRPGSPDNAPIIGELGPKGLIWATGHYRNGALLADVTGAGVSRLLTEGIVPDVLL
ncbi:MAG: glycine oxidase ThiO, partial [Pseudonocardiaceae bacterium]